MIEQQLARLPRHKYRAILADPPWTFRTFTEGGGNRSAERHYSCMRLGDVQQLDVRRVADVDCWLFLWATTPMLPWCIEVMRRWGFEYSGTAFVWAKTTTTGNRWHVGLGYTTRKNVELCLLGKRGKPERQSKSVRELIVAPVREHSHKPDEQYERIEAFCEGPYLEMFARQQHKGWCAVGDERSQRQDR